MPPVPTRRATRSVKPGTTRVGRRTGAGRQPTTRRRSSNRPGKSRSTGWFAGLGGLVLVIAIAVGARLWTKNSDSSDVKQKMHQVVRGIDSDPGNQAYLEGLVDRFHPTAFEAAYNLGGRRQSNQFKAEAYLREMARQIRAAALADGKVNLAEQIRTE